MAVVGFGFSGPVGPKGRTDRCTFDLVNGLPAVVSVTAGMKVVPLSRLVGAVCVTVAGAERAQTWGADHWQAQARSVPAHLRHMAKACHVSTEQAAVLEAFAAHFERVIPQQG